MTSPFESSCQLHPDVKSFPGFPISDSIEEELVMIVGYPLSSKWLRVNFFAASSQTLSSLMPL